MEYVLQTAGLSKRYGHIKAVQALDLKVPRGAIFGILGPNGSGKSTTLGMVLGITNPDSGQYHWFGERTADLARKSIGALLEQPNFYGYLSAYDNLRLVATIKGTGVANIVKTLEFVGLGTRMKSAFRTFSTGMKQRLALASTLLNNPDVIVLDEPTNGMDPKGIIEIRDLIKQLAAQGKTVILASHLLDEVEKVCTHVAVMKAGQLLETRQLGQTIDTTFNYRIAAIDMDGLMACLTVLPSLKLLDKQADYCLVSTTLTGSEVNTQLYEQGIVLSQLVPVTKSLEDQFLEITSDHV